MGSCKSSISSGLRPLEAMIDAVSFSRSFAPTDVRNGERAFCRRRSSLRRCDGNAGIGFESGGPLFIMIKVLKQVRGEVNSEEI